MGDCSRRHQRDHASDCREREHAGEFSRTGYLALFPGLALPLRCCLFCFAAVSHVFLPLRWLLREVKKVVGLLDRVKK